VQDLPFDDWVELSGRLSGDPPELDDGQLLPSWSAATMHARLTEVGIDYLDVFVYYGAQPDVDRDGDGLEQLFDTDGNGFVDECRDGDGTEIVGTDCPADPRIADAFALELDYGTAAAEIVGVAEP